MAIPGNTKSAFEAQIQEDKNKWAQLVCDGKNTIPGTIQQIDAWIRTITGCLKAVSYTDQIGPDDSNHIISGSFGALSGGQLMNALGDNNDCLIHSFLTCVSALFRTLDEKTRSIVANFFRRFVLTTIPNMDSTIKERFESYRFLTGAEIEFLSTHFKIPIINIQDGDAELHRSMEIFPSSDDSFLKSKNNSYTAPFYVIHGNNIHFTPVAYNKMYNKILNYGDVKALAEKITEEHDAVFEQAHEDAKAIGLVQEDFKGRIQPIVEGIKKEISAVNNTNQQEKSIKISNMLEILTPLTEEYIQDIIQQKRIKEELVNKVRTAIHATLVSELTKTVLPNTVNTSKSTSDKVKKLEEFSGQYGLSNDDALVKAIKASLNEPTVNEPKVNGPKVNEPKVNGPKVNGPREKPAPLQKVLRSINKITAQIGDVTTQYDVTVYHPTPVEIKGGKRKTKKSKRVVKQKTKRHIKK